MRKPATDGGVASLYLQWQVTEDADCNSVAGGHALPCLTAIEAALTEPFEFHVRSHLHLKSLRAETPGAWITMRFDEDLDAAAKAALRDMIELIRERGNAVRSRPMKSPDNAAASRESNN